MNHADHVALLQPGVPAPGGVWADLGSGGGAFTLALADLLGPGATIYSVDRDPGALRGQPRRLAALAPGVALVTLAADFTRPLPASVPPLDGLVMANALHFVPGPRKAAVVRQLKGALKPGGRWLLVEYNVDRGNPWVPHPLAYPAWEALARACGLTHTRLLGTRPSSFLREFYSAESRA
jgi:SAM-dependent methyltransferase